MSGHIFFNDRWPGFDDGIYAGARMLEIIAASEEKNIFYDVPNLVSTPEINIPVSDDKKFGIVEKFIENSYFDDALIIDIDGIRVEFERGWGLLRASNTSPVLVLRFEAETENDLEDIKNLFNQNLKSIDPELNIF
jgi:phosphomannomutase